MARSASSAKASRAAAAEASSIGGMSSSGISSTSPAGYSGDSKRSITLNGCLAADHDVHPPVVEALEHVIDACGAADGARAVVIAQDDAERLALLERGPDHPLVAVLEDVQRDLLARKQHEGQLEDRELETRHPGPS